jgi:hypothetical protein
MKILGHCNQCESGLVAGLLGRADDIVLIFFYENSTFKKFNGKGAGVLLQNYLKF